MSEIDQRLEALERDNAALRKINQALMQRVEASLDNSSSASTSYTLFERTVMLEDVVRERTQELETSQERLQELLDQQIQTKEELAERESLLRQLTEAMGEVFWLRCADQKTILYVNPAYEQVFGHSRQSLYDDPNSFLQCIDERDRQMVQEAFARYLKTHEFDTDYRITHADGSTRWVSARSFPVYDESGAIIRHAGIAVDITRRKQTEERLRLMSRAVMQSPAGVMITDTAYRIEDVNPALETMTGYSRDELIGANPRLLRSGQTPKETYQDFYQTITNAGVWIGEFHNRRKDGSLYWEADIIGPVRNSKGTITHYIAIKEDITQRKLMLRELQEAKDKADAANRAKSYFLANMSHEIRTPMNGVMGMAELLLETNLDRRQLDWVTTILASAQQQLLIVNDILDFSRLDSRKMPVVRERFDLHALLQQVIQPHLTRINGMNLHLLLHIPTKLPQWHLGDIQRLRQILSNLVGNALKFTEQGYVRLSAEMDHRHLMLKVEDTGIGIPRERQSAIFDAFEQADNSTTRKYGGSGLGLAICKRLCHALGGSISLDSDPHKGSTFTVTLPLDISPEQGRGRPHDHPLPLSGQAFYLISDLAPSADSILERLSANGAVLRQAPIITTAHSQVDIQGDMEGIILIDGSAAFYVRQLSQLRQQGMSQAIIWLARQDSPEHLAVVEKSGGQGYLVLPHHWSDFIPFLQRFKTAQLEQVQTRQSLEDGRKKTGSSGATGRADKANGATASPALLLADKRVLIAEDNHVNQMVLKAMLKHLGCNDPIITADGLQALQSYRKQPADVILMDIQMPEMDGVTATAAIRSWEQEQQLPAVPIIAITANAMPCDRERYLSSGMDAYLSKPLKKETLIATLKTLFAAQSD